MRAYARQEIRHVAAAVLAALLLVACGGGDTNDVGQSRIQAAQRHALEVRKPDPTPLFDWAEEAYPEFFPSRRGNELLAPWVYRFYPETGNYVGVSGDTVAVLGPLSGGDILVVGTLSDFACRVYPSDCSAPAVVAQPESRIVTAPAAATFSVIAAGAPAPSYQWQASVDGGASFTSIAGATSASYTTPATSAAESGKVYRVVLSNGAGVVESHGATLTVYADVSSYSFVALAAKMATARALHTATTLADGKVLIAGGFNGSDESAPALDTAELYDPTTDTFTPLAARMRIARIQPAAVRLLDGKVLITGGQAPNLDGNGVDSAEIYDPATRTFSLLPARMASPRGAHTATVLNDGKVLLLAGFYKGAGSLKADAELYDPATQTFTALTAKMVALREHHKATLLPDGKVLISGGAGEGNGDPVKDSAEVFDPATQTFNAIAARMSSPRAMHDATRLPGGKIMLTGGASIFNPANSVVLVSVEMFDPTTQAFAPLSAAMTSSRAGHAAAVLANGSILVTGGISVVAAGNILVLNSAELFRDSTGIARPSASITVEPTSIPVGGSATLRWTSGNATSCSASGEWSGVRDFSGALVVAPVTAGQYTYALSCAGPGGSTVASTMLAVQPSAPNVTLGSSATSVSIGATITLRWSSSNASSCTASGDWSGAKATAGSESIYAGSVATTKHFHLTCGGSSGTNTASTSIEVVGTPVPTGRCEQVTAGASNLTVRNQLPSGLEVFLPQFAFGADMLSGECNIIGLEFPGSLSIRVELTQCANSDDDSDCTGRKFGSTKVRTIVLTRGGSATLVIEPSNF